jgi:hypothetical protein
LWGERDEIEDKSSFYCPLYLHVRIIPVFIGSKVYWFNYYRTYTTLPFHYLTVQLPFHYTTLRLQLHYSTFTLSLRYGTVTLQYCSINITALLPHRTVTLAYAYS